MSSTGPKTSSESTEVRDLLVKDPKGLVVLQVGLLVTLYFREGHTQQVRERVARCFEAYRTLCGPRLKWAHPSKRGFQKLDGPPDMDPARFLREPDPDGRFEASGWEFYWHGGAQKEEASDLRVRAMGAPNRRGDELGFFSASLPLSWFLDHEGNFPSLVTQWCQTLLPLHGYGGIGLIESPRLSVAQSHGASAYALARRFPGLELDDPTTHILYLKDGIKGGNWLTVLSTAYVNAVGGAQPLTRKLGDGFEFHPYSEGVVVQAGPTPELGDVNRRIEPVRYRELARLLRPLRPQVHGGFQGFGLTREKSEEWLARFDEK